jgi:hypothetical protein
VTFFAATTNGVLPTCLCLWLLSSNSAASGRDPDFLKQLRSLSKAIYDGGTGRESGTQWSGAVHPRKEEGKLMGAADIECPLTTVV